MSDPSEISENFGGWSPSEEELEEILRQHAKWIESTGKRGKRADLSGRNLRVADLSDAMLIGADLTKADLRVADLSGANLSGANLRRAILSEANLSSVDLSGANLRRADLSCAKLHDAILDGTLFFRTSLQGAEGLETIRHFAASNLDHFTISQSDSLPISFLRGCGLPDLIINNVDVLRGDPVQFYSCFISYSSENEDFAERLHADLQNEGVRCWFAPQELEGGQKLHEQINEAIRVHDKLVLILSEASMKSNWVEHEVREARQRERKEDRQVLFPVSLTSYSDLQDWTLFDADEGRDLAREVREYYIPNFSEWKDHDAYQEAFDELISGLREADGR
jgi:uncharacterized protein YjbI with pentapeptide repeats